MICELLNSFISMLSFWFLSHTLVKSDVNIWGSWVKDIWEFSVLILQLFNRFETIPKLKVKSN